jgi:hypothetical protein
VILKGLRWLANKILLPLCRKPLRQHVVEAAEKGLEKFVQEPSLPQDVVETVKAPPGPLHVEQLRMPCHDREEDPPEVESSIEIESDLEDIEEDAETKAEWEDLDLEVDAYGNPVEDDYETQVAEGNRRQLLQEYGVLHDDTDEVLRRVREIERFIEMNSEVESRTDFLDPMEIYRIEKEKHLSLGEEIMVDGSRCRVINIAVAGFRVTLPGLPWITWDKFVRGQEITDSRAGLPQKFSAEQRQSAIQQFGVDPFADDERKDMKTHGMDAYPWREHEREA